MRNHREGIKHCKKFIESTCADVVDVVAAVVVGGGIDVVGSGVAAGVADFAVLMLLLAGRGGGLLYQESCRQFSQMVGLPSPIFMRRALHRSTFFAARASKATWRQNATLRKTAPQSWIQSFHKLCAFTRGFAITHPIPCIGSCITQWDHTISASSPRPQKKHQPSATNVALEVQMASEEAEASSGRHVLKYSGSNLIAEGQI